MKRYLSGVPSIKLKEIVNDRNKTVSIFPFNGGKCQYFFSARYALAGGLKALDIKSGDKVLIPAYNCGVELKPFYHFNIKPVFYKVDKNLRVDIEELVKIKDKNIKALMITHYLGFPQEIDEIEKCCKEKNIYLIEDCAHALLSTHNGKPLGSYGDVGIFSVLKTLPVPNGGVLVINNKNISYNHSPEKPNFFATCYYAAKLLKYRTRSNGNSIKENSVGFLSTGVYYLLSFMRLMLIGFRKYFNPKGLYLVKPDSDLFVEALRSWGISDLSKRIINKTNFEQIKIVRRRNFEYLLNYFLKNERGILPFKELPSGVCPLFFPIILESAERRVTLYNTLKNKGVITHPWWDRFHPKVPWDEFPDAVYLKERLFGLPIHQDLTINHLDRIIEEFEKAYHSMWR
jgi:dTDP-4-amino-4,6-dideoxygalactose transaminase